VCPCFLPWGAWGGAESGAGGAERERQVDGGGSGGAFLRSPGRVVLLDGTDIRSLQLKWLRQQLALGEPGAHALQSCPSATTSCTAVAPRRRAEVLEAAEGGDAQHARSALPRGMTL